MINQHYIFFDLDGTLYDSKKDILDAWTKTYQKFGINGIIPRIGPTLQEILADLDSNYNLEEIQKYFIKIYDYSQLKNTFLYKGLFDFLTILKLTGYSLNILTNKRTIPTMTLLNRDNIKDLFDAILTSDMRGQVFPKQELMQDYIIQNKINPDDCIIFGDTQNDIDTSIYNKCKVIFCKWGYGKIKDNSIKSIDLHDIDELIF